jgi:hypothetical protein
MKLKHYFLARYLVCLLILFTIPLNAQDILWEKSYGGKQADYLFDVIPTPDYGFILGGCSLSKKSGAKTAINRGDMDYWVWKMDEKGNQDWQKGMGGSGQDLLTCILLTNDGGYILAGSSESNKSLDKKEDARGSSDFWIIKLNAKGGEEWQKTIGGSGQDELTSIVRTRDGGFVLAGSSNSERSADKTSTSYGGMDYWVVKVDREGKLVWQNSFGGVYNEELRSLVATQDGGYLLGGSSNSPEGGTKTDKGLGQSDYWIVKIDDRGKEEWQKTYGGTGDDQLYVAQQLADGTYIFGGNSNSESGESKTKSNDNGTDFWVVAADKNQNVLWQETYNIAKTDVLTSLVENDDHTLLLGGYAQGEVAKKKSPSKALNGSKTNSFNSEQFKSGTGDYVALKINAKGEELWRKSVGSNGTDILKKVIETRDGGYLLTGTSKGNQSGDRSSGIEGADFWVVKLLDKDKKKEDKLPVEAIPNPAIDFTNVIVGYEYEKGTATLVDIAGHVLQQFEINDRTVPVNLQGLPEGIYVVNIKTDVQNSGVKIIKSSKNN